MYVHEVISQADAASNPHVEKLYALENTVRGLMMSDGESNALLAMITSYIELVSQVTEE